MRSSIDDRAAEILRAEGIEAQADAELDRLQRLDLDLTEDALTEDALALSFCEARPMLRFVARWNRWMQWDGVRWKEDDTLAVFDAVRQHIRRMLPRRDNKAANLSRAQSVAAIEKLTKADRRYAATTDQWDSDDWILNTPGGIVNLRTGKIELHDSGLYLTKITNAAPGGSCPAWLRFLDDITARDREFIAFLKRVTGYSLTGSSREHVLFFIYGPGGNGKGTFLNTVQRVLGDYATVASMATFTESRTEQHPTDLAMLRGARLVTAQETEEGRAWAESKIKALTGGDPITARFMRQDFFTYLPKFTLVIAGNHKPRLKNVDEAMRRRLHLLPFMQTFTRDRRDIDLADKLMAEAGGILRWMIEGCLEYQAEGLRPPDVVLAATAEYFTAENLFEQWLDDCCERGPEFWETPTRLFADWKEYAADANELPGNKNQFAERLAAAGFRQGNTRAKGGRHWDGLRLCNGRNGTSDYPRTRARARYVDMSDDVAAVADSADDDEALAGREAIQAESEA